ncbi:MAG: hypothetical protein ACLUAO_02370 [Streptococcus sp.]
MTCKRLTKSCSSITLVLARLKAQNLQVLHNHQSHHQAHQRLSRIKTETKTDQTGMDVNAIKDNNFQSLKDLEEWEWKV